ncbi:MAG: hypothetical protein WKG07_08725 [Hymenobacter sp.]
MVIAAGLSIVDPRERPTEHQQAADTAHARFADPESDFLSYLALWRYLTDQQEELSGNRFRKLCKCRVPALPAGARMAGPLHPAQAGDQEPRIADEQRTG